MYGRSVYAIAKYQHAKDPSIKFATWKLRVREVLKLQNGLSLNFSILLLKIIKIPLSYVNLHILEK